MDSVQDTVQRIGQVTVSKPSLAEAAQKNAGVLDTIATSPSQSHAQDTTKALHSVNCGPAATVVSSEGSDLTAVQFKPQASIADIHVAAKDCKQHSMTALTQHKSVILLHRCGLPTVTNERT